MDKELNLKHLLQECLRNAVKILLVGILAAILLGVYSVKDTVFQNESIEYASQGTLLIEEMPESIAGNAGQDYQAYIGALTNKHKAIITSDALLNKVAEDTEVKERDLDISKIRGKLYLLASDYSSVMNIQVADPDEELAHLLCSKVLEHAEKHFEELGYQISIAQDTFNRGEVILEETEQIVIIKPASAGKSIIKYGIIGFLGGIILAVFVVCILFIFRNRVIYPEQIEDNCGIKFLGKSSKENVYWNIYSSTGTENHGIRALSFVSMSDVGRYHGFTDGFAAFLGNAGKRVLVIEHVKNPLPDEDMLSVHDRNGYQYAEINDELLLKEKENDDIITSLKEKYDIMIFKAENISEYPMGRLLMKYAENAVILLEQNKEKLVELYKTKETAEKNGVTFVGAVLMEKGKK